MFRSRRAAYIAAGIALLVVILLLASCGGASCGAGTVETRDGECVSVNRGGDDDDFEEDDD